jgi:hypothetical protein
MLTKNKFQQFAQALGKLVARTFFDCEKDDALPSPVTAIPAIPQTMASTPASNLLCCTGADDYETSSTQHDGDRDYSSSLSSMTTPGHATPPSFSAFDHSPSKHAAWYGLVGNDQTHRLVLKTTTFEPTSPASPENILPLILPTSPTKVRSSSAPIYIDPNEGLLKLHLKASVSEGVTNEISQVASIHNYPGSHVSGVFSDTEDGDLSDNSVEADELCSDDETDANDDSVDFGKVTKNLPVLKSSKRTPRLFQPDQSSNDRQHGLFAFSDEDSFWAKPNR